MLLPQRGNQNEKAVSNSPLIIFNLKQPWQYIFFISTLVSTSEISTNCIFFSTLSGKTGRTTNECCSVIDYLYSMLPMNPYLIRMPGFGLIVIFIDIISIITVYVCTENGNIKSKTLVKIKFLNLPKKNFNYYLHNNQHWKTYIRMYDM